MRVRLTGVVGPNAINVLRELGVLESVVAHSGQRGLEARSFEFRIGAGDCKSVYSVSVSWSSDNRSYLKSRESTPRVLTTCLCQYIGEFIDGSVLVLSSYHFYSADLLEALAEFIALEDAVTHFNKRCVDITPFLGSSSRSIIHFDDGSSHITDVVLGADGVKSAVRQFVSGDEISASPPSFTGTTAYRGLVDTAVLHHVGVPTNMTARPVCWLGQGKVRVLL